MKRTAVFLVLVLSLSLVLVPGVGPAGAQVVATGTIVGSTTPRSIQPGSPPANAFVAVRAYDLDRHLVAQGGAGLDGQYSITVPAGDYYVLFFPSGFDALGYFVPELFLNARTWADATPVTVPAGGSVTADASLEGAGRMGGRIVDQFGSPVPGCAVFSLAVGTDPIIYEVVGSAADGRYGLIGLLDGDNQVAADCGPGYTPVVAPFTVHTPSVPGGSTTVPVPDVVVTRLPGTVTGTLVSTTGVAQPGACVVAFSPAGAVLGSTTAGAGSGGRWVMTGVPDGPARFGVFDCTGQDRFAPVWFDGAASFAAATDVPVTSAAAMPEVDVVVTVWGHLQVDAAAGACAWVTDTAGTTLAAAAYLSTSSTTVRLAPGNYKVLLGDCGGGWAPVWYHDAASAATAEVVGVAGGTTTHVTQALVPA